MTDLELDDSHTIFKCKWEFRDKTLRFSFTEPVIIDHEFARQMVNERDKNFPLPPHVILADLSNLISIEGQASDLLGTERALSNTWAVAIRVNNLMQKKLTENYVRFSKPQRPVKIFTKEEEAIEWLKEYKSLI